MSMVWLSANVLLLCVETPRTVLRGVSTLMRSDMLRERSERGFRAPLRLNRLIAQTSEIHPSLP
jgi:hypothetical protein